MVHHEFEQVCDLTVQFVKIAASSASHVLHLRYQFVAVHPSPVTVFQIRVRLGILLLVVHKLHIRHMFAQLSSQLRLSFQQL